MFQPIEIVLKPKSFETKINGKTSNRYQIQSGVPQGSTLGLLLDVLYTSDIP